MKKFIVHTTIFLCLVFLTIYAVALMADGYTDPFYVRFTTPKQTSLIIGTSRAAQGIQPQVLNSILGRKDIFNYAFTLAHSPYGPVYLNSIKHKLDTTAKNGIFIVQVDPWSISANKKSPNDTSLFKELNLPLATTPLVNMKPNFIYLMNNADNLFYKLFLHTKYEFVHNNGWLDVSVKMDSTAVKQRINEKLADYHKTMVPNYTFSKKRLEYLNNTIDYLKKHGKVYLVRLPVHPAMFALDNALVPDFNNLLTKISLEKQTPYLDLSQTNTDLFYTDGNHLFKDSGKKISLLIGNWILEQQQILHL